MAKGVERHNTVIMRLCGKRKGIVMREKFTPAKQQKEEKKELLRRKEIRKERQGKEISGGAKKKKKKAGIKTVSERPRFIALNVSGALRKQLTHKRRK